MVSCTDAGIMVTLFVVPPSTDIEQPCGQLQDFLTCRTPESRQPYSLCSLQAISSARTLPRKLPEFSSSSFLTDRFQPLRPESSLVLSAGPSGASDWVGCQDLYYTVGGITYLCIGHCLVRPFRSDDSPIRRIRR